MLSGVKDKDKDKDKALRFTGLFGINKFRGWKEIKLKNSKKYKIYVPKKQKMKELYRPIRETRIETAFVSLAVHE